MSELIEINEDNCVLDKNEIETISDVFKICLGRLGLFGKSDTGIYLNTITLKINKLNDLAKDKNKQLETLAKAVVKYCNDLSYMHEEVYLFSDNDYKAIIKECFLPTLNQEDKKFE